MSSTAAWFSYPEPDSRLDGFEMWDASGNSWVCVAGNRAGFRSLARLLVELSELTFDDQHVVYVDANNMLGTRSDAGLVLVLPPRGEFDDEWVVANVACDDATDALLHALGQGNRSWRDAESAFQAWLNNRGDDVSAHARSTEFRQAVEKAVRLELAN